MTLSDAPAYRRLGPRRATYETTCVIYYWVSSDNQKEQKTIISQQYELPRYAESQGWTIIDTYTAYGIYI